MNTISYFEIQSERPEESAAFYKKVFGWNFVRDPLVPIEYYRTTDQGAGMMGAILKRPAKTPPLMHGTNAFTCSVQVEDFDATAAIILENGGQVAMPKFAIAGRCFQGYFIDTDHNVFGIFEADPSAA